MSTVTIPKKEYQSLLDAKLRYEYARRVLEDDLFSPPPTRKAATVMKAFRAVKKYNHNFLARLEKGLKRSSHFRA